MVAPQLGIPSVRHLSKNLSIKGASVRLKIFVVAAIASVLAGLGIWKLKEGQAGTATISTVPAVNTETSSRTNAVTAVVIPSPSAVAPNLAASRAVVKPTSYSGERDLWAFAKKAAAAAGQDNAFEALSAARTCQQFLATVPQLSEFLVGGKSPLQGARTPEREQAITEMKSRCAGFEQNAAEAKSLAKELSGSLAGTPYAPNSTTISKAQLRELLSSDSPDAVALGALHLLEPWQRKLKIPDNDPREADLAAALVLSKCDLGVDCTSNGDSIAGSMHIFWTLWT